MFINGLPDYDRSGKEVKTGLVIAKATCDGDIRVTGTGKEIGSISVRAYGRKDGTAAFLTVKGWGKLGRQLSTMVKGDRVIAAGRLESREYNGKTYYSVSADGVYPGAAVVFRWLQQVIDCIPAGPPAAPAEFTPVNAPVPAEFTAPGDLAGHELYPGEKLSDHSPPTSARKTIPVQMKLGDAPIEEAEDLPF